MSAVLIVENRTLIRLSLAGLVEMAGCEGIQVNNAEEALPVLERRADIVLLITNVIMQGSMDGVELANTVDRRWPAIKIIVVTGKAGMSENDLPKKSLFFAKPYHDEEMLFEIRSLTGASAG